MRDLSLAQMEAIVARFEERVDAAQLANTPTKEWVRRAVLRQGAPRCPVRIKRLSIDIIVKYGEALADLLCEYPDDVLAAIPYDITIGYQPPGKEPRINTIAALTQAMEWSDEWGSRWGHAAGGVGATPVDYPLRDWGQLDEYLATCVPDPRAAGRLDASAALLSRHRAAKYCYGIIHLALFERLHALRGMDNVFVDLYEHRDDVERLLEVLAGYLLELIRYWAELGADAMFLTDDWGSQNALMISPAMWRAIFRPHYEALVRETHRMGMQFILHSCGNVIDIVGDLVEIGVDVLDPIQPGAIDLEELARRHGGTIAFSGALDVQDLLVYGTPSEVRDGIRRTLDTIARPFGNAIIVGPANIMTPEVPLANIRAMCEACRQ